MKKKKKWIRPYHNAVIKVVFPPLGLYTKLHYHIKVEKCRDKRPLLILFNHQTAFDQFFVTMSFYRSIYYVASEDLFSKGFVSDIIRTLVAPIPITKNTTDLRAVMTCMQVAKEGGTIALAPEGNRTFSGKTEYMNPAIARLAKKLKLPIAFFRIEGGYGVHPRWADDVRKGTMRAYVSRILEPEEYISLSDEELNSLICKELYVDEAVADATFSHKNSAEYLERAIYVCPDCGLSEFYSEGAFTHCKKCGCKITYLPTKELKGMEKEFPFRFVNDWYEYQKDYINHWNPLEHVKEPLYQESITLEEVILYQKKVPMFSGKMALYGNRIEIQALKSKKASDENFVFSFDEITGISVLGRNILNVYTKEKLYQIRGDKHFNALKYVNIFYRYKNIAGGRNHEQFLGL